MGSCLGCLYRDSIPNNHPTKFKVINVDDEGMELGSGVMELTQRELVLHLHRRDAVRWPYLCLRRYGFDSNLFSFESGRRCQTGQGIFAFKCSRAEELFNLLQDLMQCNSISVMEEPVVVTRSSHSAEMGLPQTPHAANALGYTVSGFSNGFPSFPADGPSYSTPRPASMSSLRHSSLGEESTHALIAPEEQSHTYVNTPGNEEDRRGRRCLQPLPEGRAAFPSRARSCVLDSRDPKVFLQPGQVKFVLDPSSSLRHVVKCQGYCGSPGPECGGPLCSGRQGGPAHNNNNECPAECLAQPKCTYENLTGGGLPRGGSWRLSQEELSWNGFSQRRAALLHYENLPSLPPVWESQAHQPGDEDDGDSRDGLTPSSNGYPDGGDEDETPLQNYINARAAPRSHINFPVPLSRRRGSPRVFNFDFRRPGPEPPRQLNYIQVELKGWAGDRPKEHQSPPAQRPPVSSAHPTRRSDSYAVIDLKKTAAMSSLQRALPRDDGTSRKTRHNSTDLPL
ncbi:fibroblast growth factor receptor substrate 3 [Gracilinanus agilis]|uniref:fibroblast growth factor receptor substrate 3 n=1 Tax=Gracilinanus agilis TaxID=191870 RepID=UPI001CFDE4EE|nr:fibroblast growth factor receptor substrate 3 [Gracilinanus agilis]